jgi:hypothetical protein
MMNNDEATFWSRMMKQHCKFLSQLLNYSLVPKFVQEAKSIEQEWNDTPIFIDSLVCVLGKTRELKRKIIHEGSFSPLPINVTISREDFMSLVQHMLEELDYFEDSLHRDLSEQDELSFWTRETEEHMKLTADTLLDGESIRREIYMIVDQMKKENLGSLEQIDLYLQSSSISQKLFLLLQDNKVHSLIDLEMLAHEIEESLQGQEKLMSLGFL